MADTPEERPDDDATRERPDDDATRERPAVGAGAPTEGGESGAVAKPTPAAPIPRPAPKTPAVPDEKPYVAAAKRRRKMPLWAVPLLAALPIWAIVYVNAVTKPPKHDPLTIGATLFADNCASCHGAQGQGVSAPALDGGDVLKTWPKYKDHLTWVEDGSAGWQAAHPGAKTYGGQNHPLAGGMPAFKDSLSSGDIALIVRYEREGLSAADPTSAAEAPLVACTLVAVNTPDTDCSTFTAP